MGRLLGAVTLSCVGLTAVCAVGAIGYARLTGCPIMGDPGGEIDFHNDDSVSLIIYPEGVQVPSVRRVLASGDRVGWGYIVSCGSAQREDQVWRTIGAEYAGVWVYCREVTRGEIAEGRLTLVLRRGELQCTPAVAPAGPP